jgi:hypothetical protein
VNITMKQIDDQMKIIRREMREARARALEGRRSDAYAAAERCQHAAFDLKQMFTISTKGGAQ